MIERNPVPDAPGLVEYRGLDAVAEARCCLDITSVEYNTRLKRVEQNLNLGERFWRLTLVLVTRAKALAL